MRMGHSVLLPFLLVGLTVTSAQLLGGAENIDDLSEPEVVSAANAAVLYLNNRNPPDSKELILVRIISGTRQVINGIRYNLNIEVADAQTCLNDNTTSTIDQCPIDMNTVNTWNVVVVASTGSPVMYTVESTMLEPSMPPPLPGGKVFIQNFTDPRIIGAVCAATDRITAMSDSIYKSIPVVIVNGTSQVVNGLKYDMLIVVALSTTCQRDSDLCTSVECPFDECTQYLWMVSVVTSPTPIYYNVLAVTPIRHIGAGGVGMKMTLQNFSDPHVRGAACVAINQITAKSNSVYKSVLVVITSGTYQVVNGIRYDLFIKVALSTTCTRDSQLCTSMECPIDEQTLSEWMVSVVASSSVPVNYSVLSTTPVNTVEDTGGVATMMPYNWLFVFAILVIFLINFSI